MARFPLWGVILQPFDPDMRGNKQLPDTERREREHLTLADYMARAISNTIRECAHCRPRALEAVGFTAAEIASGWTIASALAHSILGRNRP